jgi:hypothetical protein
MASVSFPFASRRKFNNVDATIFEGFWEFVNASQ